MYSERSTSICKLCRSASGRPSPAHDLDPLIALVDPDVVAETAQRAGDEICELALAGRAVAITEDENGRLAAPPKAPVSV